MRSSATFPAQNILEKEFYGANIKSTVSWYALFLFMYIFSEGSDTETVLTPSIPNKMIKNQKSIFRGLKS